MVDVDELEDRDLRHPPARRRAGTAGRRPSTTTVRVRAASSRVFVGDPPKTAGLAFVTADLARREALKNPGQQDLLNVPVLLPIHDRENVTLSTVSINAKVTVRDTDETYKIASVTVFKTTPVNFEQQFTVVYDQTLANVTVIGPPAAIATMKPPPNGGQPAFAPRARLDVTGNDKLDVPIERIVQYDLPPGVRPDPESACGRSASAIRRRTPE